MKLLQICTLLSLLIASAYCANDLETRKVCRGYKCALYVTTIDLEYALRMQYINKDLYVFVKEFDDVPNHYLYSGKLQELYETEESVNFEYDSEVLEELGMDIDCTLTVTLSVRERTRRTIKLSLDGRADCFGGAYVYETADPVLVNLKSCRGRKADQFETRGRCLNRGCSWEKDEGEPFFCKNPDKPFELD